MPVTIEDLSKLGEICSSVCFYLTAHLGAVAAGTPASLPPEVSQIYQLAAALPPPEQHQWTALMRHKSGGAAAAAATAAVAGHGLSSNAKEPGSRKRIKWSSELEAELKRIVEDEDFRAGLLGKEGTRGGHLNWAAVARYYGGTNPAPFKAKYGELTGQTVEKKARKPEDEGEDDQAANGDKPAKKAKKSGEAGAAKPAAPAAAPTPATGPTPGGAEWTKQQEEDLKKLVESEDARKTLLGKKKLRWKKIAEHVGHKSKACRKHYTKLTGKEAPEDED